MHTELRIDVESIDSSSDGGAQAFIVSAKGHGQPQRCVAATVDDVKLCIATMLDKWENHNIDLVGAESGRVIESHGIVG